MFLHLLLYNICLCHYSSAKHQRTLDIKYIQYVDVSIIDCIKYGRGLCDVTHSFLKSWMILEKYHIATFFLPVIYVAILKHIGKDDLALFGKT